MSKIDVSKSVAYALIHGPGNRVAKSTGFILTGKENAAHVAKCVAYVLLAPASSPSTAGSEQLRSWTFSLDGHDFYVLRLGDFETLVLDLVTGQWSRWFGHGLAYLRAHLGLNWLGLAVTSLNRGFSWNVVAGDDSGSQLWMMEPVSGIDESPGSGTASYQRRAAAAVPMRLRATAPCYEVFLTASLGNPALVGATVTLETSDDQGQTWLNHGAITITAGAYTQELSWPSLGLIRAPGRIFRVTDEGALTRLSSLDMR